jgi:hypothetical protein
MVPEPLNLSGPRGSGQNAASQSLVSQTFYFQYTRKVTRAVVAWQSGFVPDLKMFTPAFLIASSSVSVTSDAVMEVVISHAMILGHSPLISFHTMILGNSPLNRLR